MATTYVPAQMSSVVSLRSVTRTITTSSIPANWFAPTFDDSGWVLSGVPEISVTSYIYPGSPGGNFPAMPDGAEACAPWVVAPTSSNADLYTRMHFTAPSSPWLFWTLEILGPVPFNFRFYINGDGSNVPNTPRFKVYASDINMGGDNVMAIEAHGPWNAIAGGFEAWAGWRIQFFVPDAGGTVYSWGTNNSLGTLGVGDTALHLRPAQTDPALPTNIVKVASNGKTTLFLTNVGDLYACGDNSQGFLGNGTTDANPHPTPALVAAFGTSPQMIQDISIGQDCAMALMRYKDVFAWGANAFGSLGIGSTGAVLFPELTYRGIGMISAGKNFAVACDTGQESIFGAGDNTYGQLGQGTSGGTVLTPGIALQTNFGLPAGLVSEVSAGDDQLIIRVGGDDPHVVGAEETLGCGRAEYGSLGAGPYLSGTGPNLIQSTPVRLSTGVSFGVLQCEQAGLMSFFRTSTLIKTTSALGNGVPFGGAGDGGAPFVGTGGAGGDGTTVYGTPPNFLKGIVMLNASASFWPIDGLAYSGAGSQNNAVPNNSEVTFAAWGYRSDAKLYTWGWGGAGQMGNGGTTATNLNPISQNGLVGVIGACVCAGAVFAITKPAIQSSGRAWGQIIGD